MKYIYLTLGIFCIVALLVLYFQNTGVAISSTMTGIFFRGVKSTDGLMLPFMLLGFGAGMFLSLGISGIINNTFDNDDGFSNL